MVPGSTLFISIIFQFYAVAIFPNPCRLLADKQSFLSSENSELEEAAHT